MTGVRARPAGLERSLAQMSPVVNETMNGASEFTVTWRFRDCMVFDRLSEIRVPTSANTRLDAAWFLAGFVCVVFTVFAVNPAATRASLTQAAIRSRGILVPLVGR